MCIVSQRVLLIRTGCTYLHISVLKQSVLDLDRFWNETATNKGVCLRCKLIIKKVGEDF